MLDSKWPLELLEAVPACPICGSTSRRVLHIDLIDDTFFTAPGKWTMKKCEDCGTGYLDPRPTSDSVGAAYASYYTHGSESRSRNGGLKDAVRQVLQFFSDSYVAWLKNSHYELGQLHRLLAGATVKALAPCREVIDARYRHLRRPITGNDRLLDVGCGGGEFLQRIREIGWNAEGVDFDLKAVEVAQARGLNAAVGAIENYVGIKDKFDVVTCNHVIEHVYNAERTIAMMYQVLKPGGMLWIETPNIDSVGHAMFGSAWRGLESPRHIAILSAKKLAAMLTSAGFEVIRRTPWNIQHIRQMFSSSEAMAAKGDPHNTHTPVLPNLRLVKGLWLETIGVDRREFVCLRAIKPAS